MDFPEQIVDKIVEYLISHSETTDDIYNFYKNSYYKEVVYCSYDHNSIILKGIKHQEGRPTGIRKLRLTEDISFNIISICSKHNVKYNNYAQIIMQQVISKIAQEYESLSLIKGTN